MVNNSQKSGFPWITLLGTLLAVLLCVTLTGMVFFIYPQSGNLVEALFWGSSHEVRTLSSANSIFSNEPTPFQPLPTVKAASDNKPPSQPSPEPTLAPTPTPEPQPEPAASAPDSPPPASAYISGLYGSPQLYTLDCESQAAVDWARYFGVEINEYEFIDRLPVSDDPELGFVGDINGPMGQIPPGDYGVYPGPVADLLREYGLNAKALKNWDIRSLKQEIAAGRPVIVWIVNLPFSVNPSEYTPSNGNTTVVAPFQHTWIVTGYNSGTFTVVDSEWTYNVIASTFIERWNALENRAVILVED